MLKGRLRYVFLAAVLVGIYFAFNYQEIVHRAAILRALDPAFPARAYERDILAVDWGGTHALVRVAPTSGCDRSFDVELSWHDGWWWMEKLTEINDPGCFS
ncbi:MAG TPA: hypothetical protein VD886_25910 [Herpetosiphonaceae bacterium]|nr:hypothetical protein [Herpetosiphonaceae bacterium]